MDIKTERIDLGTFQKMWNGEIDAIHDQMVDVLEDSSVWQFVLDETNNGSAKVFEFFMEYEMPSRHALIQLMNTVPNEWYELSEEELYERIGINQFEEFAIIYYILLGKAKAPGFYKGDVGNMYYDGFWLIQPLFKNENERLTRKIINTALQYGYVETYEDWLDLQKKEIAGNEKSSQKLGFAFGILLMTLLVILIVYLLIHIDAATFAYGGLIICLVALLIYWLVKGRKQQKTIPD